MTREEWQGLHEAHIGNLSKYAAEEAWAWAKDKDDEVLRKTYVTIGRSGKYKKLGGVMEVYDVEYSRRYPSDSTLKDCDYCFKSGLVYVLCGGTCSGDARMLKRSTDLNQFTYIARSTIPCICPTGLAIQRTEDATNHHRFIFNVCAYRVSWEVDRRMLMALGHDVDSIEPEQYYRFKRFIDRVANGDPKLMTQLNQSKRRSKWSRESE